ncbi:SUMO1 sentrin specific peptidase 8 [Borealophlyctis nickersoniae]|nr:SUMO1 sentrin specific peptidase 8 [Borealophlyctis nickersoniae]
MVHLLAHISDPTDLASALPPGLQEKLAVFIPVNDEQRNVAGGGSHWSLMVYFRPTNTFYYYDSLGTLNRDSAKQTMRSLTPLIAGEATSSFFADVDTPPQTNPFDCGVYVMAITELIASRITSPALGAASIAEKPGDLSRWRLSDLLRPEDVKKKRQEVKQLILKFAEEQQGK